MQSAAMRRGGLDTYRSVADTFNASWAQARWGSRSLSRSGTINWNTPRSHSQMYTGRRRGLVYGSWSWPWY